MIINTNVSALNAWRNLTSTDGALSKSLERLSSGLRINRAADDAAGLAVSEKMRAQIRGLNQAVRNAQDGISLVQTAEAATTEIHSMLQRMRELAIQSANDVLTSSDRANLQLEADALFDEINRISRQTQFNTLKLINGDFDVDAVDHDGNALPGIDLQLQIGANEGEVITFGVKQINGLSLGIRGALLEEGGVEANLVGQRTTTADDLIYNITGAPVAPNYIKSINAVYLDDALGGGPVLVDPADYIADPDNGRVIFVNPNAGTDTITVDYTWVDVSAQTPVLDGDGFEKYQAIDISSDATAAGAAITAITAAIDTVSTLRATMGAVQNRLEHTINNLSIASENLSASESRIRDVDMALEMTKFTKNQILIQAGTAMLAQANAKNQTVLQLLR